MSEKSTKTSAAGKVVKTLPKSVVQSEVVATEKPSKLAQLVERFVYTEDVGSSSLSSPTILPLFERQSRIWVALRLKFPHPLRQ